MKKWLLSLLLLASPALADTTFPPSVVAQFPNCSSLLNGATIQATNGASATDCSVGSGSTKVLCWCNGSSWTAVSASGGSGDITDVWACTTGNCNSITGASGDSLDAGSADSISPATRSTSVPATCTEGFVHQETDAGGVETYTCTASNKFRQHAPYDYDPDEPARGTGVDYAEEYVGGAEALSWTTGNWSTTTSTFAAGAAWFQGPAGAGENVRFRGMAAPTGKDYLVAAKIAVSGNGLNYISYGVSTLNGTLVTPTEIHICGRQGRSTHSIYQFWGRWTNYTTYGANHLLLGMNFFMHAPSPAYVGLFVDHTAGDPDPTYTIQCIMSNDGVFWWAYAAAYSLGKNPPAYVGVALNTSTASSTVDLGVFWWRTISGSRITSPGQPVLILGGPL